MQRRSHLVLFAVLALILASGIATRAGGASPETVTAPSTTLGASEQIKRGEYLVRFGSCHDCHTPHKLGPQGPEPDMSRMLSGHPADVKVALPKAPYESVWMLQASQTMTAWTGAWGISFTANLTPDKETGLGNWTEDMFITALRTGRHEGRGRPILPPMPWPMIGKASDEDLKAIFAFLQSIPAVHNKVPSPVDPPEEGTR